MSFARLKRWIKAVLSLLLNHSPEGDVSKSWLFRNSSRLDRNFIGRHEYTITPFEDYLRFQIKDENFLWPANLPTHTMEVFLSELFIHNHPHRYLWGPTQIESDDVVLDIGACEGAFTAFIASRCREVIAIEPSRSMCAVIRKQFQFRQKPSPKIVECLLGSQNSNAYFLENLENPGASRITNEAIPGAYEVPIYTLDQLTSSMEAKPTFIKCDAEGAALQIFKGGMDFLRTYKPKLAIASYHTDSEYLDLYALLHSLGYQIKGKGFLLSGEKLRVQMLHAWA